MATALPARIQDIWDPHTRMGVGGASPGALPLEEFGSFFLFFHMKMLYLRHPRKNWPTEGKAFLVEAANCLEIWQFLAN